MKLEQQVSNPTLSERLRELGVKQKSLFYWTDWCLLTEKAAKKTVQLRNGHPHFDKCHYSYFWEQDICSAFTVAELGEFVPKGEYVETFFHSLEIQLTCTFQRPIAEKDVFVGSNEADCRAKMLIYLIEINLITL